MNDTPKISVIIPCYNAEKYLSQAIESVLNQTCSNVEIVVVDDGSTDGSLSVAERYGKQITLVSQKNCGVARARNQGFERSNPASRFVMFLDADDVLEPEALATLELALHSNPAAVAAHGLARFIDQHGNACYENQAEAYSHSRRKVTCRDLADCSQDCPTTFSMLAYLNYIWTPGTVLIRRTALEAAGPFNSSIVPCEDWGLWLRLTQDGDIAFVDQVVLGYRRHESNASDKEKVMRAAEIAMRRQLIQSDALTAEQRQIAISGFRHSERHFSALRLGLAKKALVRGRLIMAAKLLRRAVILYINSLLLRTA